MDDRDLPWAQVFARSPLPVWVADAGGRMVAVGDELAALVGGTAAEIEGRLVDHLVRPDDRARLRRSIGRLLSGEIDRFETDQHVVRRDGSDVLVHLACRAVGRQGDRTHLVGMLTEPDDAPDRVGHRIADRLLGFGSERVTLVDRSGRVRTVHDGHPTVTERPGEPGGGPADVPLARGEWERVLGLREEVADHPGGMIEVDVEVRTVDGAARTITAQVYNCLDDPLLSGFVVVTRDITTERAGFVELAERRRHAEAAVDARTRLLATVSHELRNPLHAAHGIAELLAADDLPVGAADLAGSLVRQLASLSRVTQDLLDAARLEVGSVVIVPGPTDLRALVGDVVELGRAAAGDRPVSIAGRVAHDVPRWVMADADRLRQILTNLVGNAVRFTQRGAVEVAVRLDAADRTVFSVVDTGVGIPLDEQRVILEPFAVASTAGSERGAGLGLSVVERLVGAMGGTMTLQSTVGRGTRIDVTLPFAECDPPPSVEQTSTPSGLRVLVIEDNPVNQQLALRQLERLGFDATVVGTGEDGYELLAADPSAFDVVLMDQQLPGWSGVETTIRIRELGGDAESLPVIGVSASATGTDRATFLDAGMDDLVAKPATLMDLSDAIARVRSDGGARWDPEPPVDDRDADAAPGPAAIGANAVVDEVLLRLSAEVGEGVTRGIVATFLDELPGRVEAVGSAVDAGGARRAAHTLTSSARLVGADELADLCRQIERGTAEPAELGAVAARAATELADWQRRQVGGGAGQGAGQPRW